MIRKTAFAAALAFALPAHAVDGFSFEAGSGKGTGMWRAGVQWDWQAKWFTGGDWHVGGYWDLQLGQWDGQYTITDIGITPVFRFQQSRPSGVSPYLEGAIGFHLLSKTRINDNRAFGSAFQFGDHVGAGLRFGSRGRYDLSLRYQHLSNAGIKKPNNGINFTQIRFQYHFD